MKPEEAIEILSNELRIITDMISYCRNFEECNDMALAYRIKRQKAMEAAISALEEIQQYREIGTVEELMRAKGYLCLAKKCGTIGKVIEECAAYEEIGTVEECREGAEKQKPKKPEKVTNSGIRHTDDYICPNCGKHFTGTGIAEYCYHCGQAIQWNLEGNLEG